MPNVVLNYQELIDSISIELKYIWKELIESPDKEIVNLISNIKGIIVSDEQFFRKQEANRALRRGTVYLVVRFSAGAINYDSSVVPISIYGLGIANQVKPVQVLLGTFASHWTTKNLCDGLTANINGVPTSLKDSKKVQVWNTPEVISNFNVVDDDFRNLYRITGNVIIGPNAVRLGTLTYYYQKTVDGNTVEVPETISFMEADTDLRSSPDPQPFGDTYGFAKTEVQFSTDTLTISTYLLNTQLIADAFSAKGFVQTQSGGDYKSSTKGQNDWFKIILTYTNGFSNSGSNDFFKKWKLVSFSIKQPLADIAMAVLVFTH